MIHADNEGTCIDHCRTNLDPVTSLYIFFLAMSPHSYPALITKEGILLLKWLQNIEIPPQCF